MKTFEPSQILVVDDNPKQRMLLARTFKQQGHIVHPAESGARALEMLAAQPFDAVLCEIDMPDMDGFQVLEYIVGDESLCEIPVLMTSGLGENAGVVACIEMGAADYLHKPFDAALLRARLERCLAKRRADRREAALYRELQGRYLRLQELEDLRDSLTHMIVHDLRTPLTSLLSGLQTAECLSALDCDQQECIGMAINGGQNLLSMVNDLLDISKMEGGTLSLEKRPLNIHTLVCSSVAQVEPLAREKGLKLSYEIEEGLPFLVADEEKLGRVLVNLLGNALKFTPAGGEVIASASFESWPEHGDSLVFSVSDTGEGIPPEAFEKIFEKFGQVESRQGGRKSSTGLGLTFCKMAIEAHRGRVWVNSMPGYGSTFYAAVPVTTPSTVLAKPESGSQG